MEIVAPSFVWKLLLKCVLASPVSTLINYRN